MSGSHAITVEDLLALNDEIRALTRAGVPLDRGLRDLGGDLPGRLGRLAESLGQRLGRGESLAAALTESSDAFPPVYRAVVAAGMRAGRLPAALESISQSVRRAAEVRRTMIVAMIYPLIVLQIAGGVFLFTTTKTLPVMTSIIPDMVEQEMPAWFRWFVWSANEGQHWIGLVWIVLIALGMVWLIRSQRAAFYGSAMSRGWPTISAVFAAGRAATFSEMLALLVEQQVPLDEALSLSGAASNDRQLERAANALAEQVRSGVRQGPTPAGMPPLLAWLIVTNSSPQQLVATLRQTARSFRQRAARLSIWLGIYLPILISAVTGGLVALYYVMLVMLPFIYLMRGLS